MRKRPPISRNCILRFSLYKKAIYRFKEGGLARITSSQLAEAVGVTPVQVRKDFSFFRIEGNKRGGYPLDRLLQSIKVIFRKHEVIKTVIVGAGNLGSAFMKYRGFEKEGFGISAAFDVDPSKCARKKGVPILPFSRLKTYVRKNRIKIGIIAVPDACAQRVLDTLVEAGIEGVLNFAPAFLRYPEDKVIVSHVNVEQELENLAYFVHLRRGAGRS